MKNFCKKCATLFEGKTYGKDKICGDCQGVLKKLGLPITAELKWKEIKTKEKKAKKKGK